MARGTSERKRLADARVDEGEVAICPVLDGEVDRGLEVDVELADVLADDEVETEDEAIETRRASEVVSAHERSQSLFPGGGRGEGRVDAQCDRRYDCVNAKSDEARKTPPG